MQVFTKSIMSRDSCQTILDLGKAAFQANSFLHFLCRSVEGEYINKQSKDTRCIMSFQDCGSLLAKLREIHEVIILIIRSKQLEISKVRLLADSDETVVVRTGHKDINIVIPWYHAMMANCPDGCSATTIIVYMVLFTNGNQFFQDAEYDSIPLGLLLGSYFLHICFFFVDGAKLLRKKERISIFIIIFVAKIQSS